MPVPLDPLEKLRRELVREQDKRRRTDLVIEALERRLEELRREVAQRTRRAS